MLNYIGKVYKKWWFLIAVIFAFVLSLSSSTKNNKKSELKNIENAAVAQQISTTSISVVSDFTLDHIKDIIYNEDRQGALTDAVAMFDNSQGGIKLQNVLDVLNDV
jgi:hypothetical protein